MILKVGMKFKYNGSVFIILGQGSSVHHLQVRDQEYNFIDLHIDEFNRLYEEGEIKIIEE